MQLKHKKHATLRSTTIMNYADNITTWYFITRKTDRELHVFKVIPQ